MKGSQCRGQKKTFSKTVVNVASEIKKTLHLGNKNRSKEWNIQGTRKKTQKLKI